MAISQMRSGLNGSYFKTHSQLSSSHGDSLWSFPRRRESRGFRRTKTLGPRRSLPSTPIGGEGDEVFYAWRGWIGEVQIYPGQQCALAGMTVLIESATINLKPFALSLSKGIGFDRLRANGVSKKIEADSINKCHSGRFLILYRVESRHEKIS